MDRFLVKTVKKASPSKQRSKSHLAVNIDAKERARKYADGTFHVDDGLMFCSSCNIVVNHVRKSIADKHLESVTHKAKDKKNQTGKQKTIKTTLSCQTNAQLEKIAVCHEWIRVCAGANIPLNKSDNPLLRTFLNSRVINGGAIPGHSQLRDYYLFDVYKVERDSMNEMLENKKVALMVDELSDDEGRYVLDILAVILDFDELSPDGNTVAYLLDSRFLTVTNNSTISQGVMKTIQNYSIEYDNVRIFNSDNVAYMKKAFADTLSCIFPLCIHITCHSHIVNLVASDFKKCFKEVTEFAKCFRNLFYVPSGRKSRYLRYLQGVLNDGESVTVPPNPTTKSWSAWFDSVFYHSDRFHLYQEFIQAEVDRAPRTACNSLLRLLEMYQDTDFLKQLHAQFAFIKDKAPPLMFYLNYFQEKIPHVTQAHIKMSNLLQYLQQHSNLDQKNLQFCFTGIYEFSSNDKRMLISKFQSAFISAHAKLSKYIEDGAQPASKFLRQVQVLDPNNIIELEKDYDAIDSIPEFETVSRDEWELYANKLAPVAVMNSKDGKVNLKLFWKAKCKELPNLYRIASCYCTGTIGSYDVERSFSAYSNILDNKRRSLEENTLKALHFLNWNLKVKNSGQEANEQIGDVLTSVSKIPPVEEATSSKTSVFPGHFSTRNIVKVTSGVEKQVCDKRRSCYCCLKEVAYGHTCKICNKIICTFGTCSVVDETDFTVIHTCKACHKMGSNVKELSVGRGKDMNVTGQQSRDKERKTSTRVQSKKRKYDAGGKLFRSILDFPGIRAPANALDSSDDELFGSEDEMLESDSEKRKSSSKVAKRKEDSGEEMKRKTSSKEEFLGKKARIAEEKESKESYVRFDELVGKYVEVEFQSMSGTKMFLGIVQSVDKDSSEIEVRFMKEVRGCSYFVWPEKDDVSWVPYADVSKVRDSPSVNARGHYSFD